MHLHAGLTSVVTGAASGIGLALAHALAGRGLNVVLADRDEAKLTEAVATLPAGGGRFLTVVTDVSDAGSVEALAATTTGELGPVHLLVNNAGILRVGTPWEVALPDWQAVFGVNVFGIVHGYSAFVPAMLAHGQPSHVLNTASMGGLIAGSHAAPYVASKHAAVSLSESLAAAVVRTNLGVTVLCPGSVATDIFDSEVRRRQTDGVRGLAGTEKTLAHMADPSRDLDSPEAVAAVALEAVEGGELYAITCPPSSRGAVRNRLAAIEQALRRDEARTV